MAGPTIWAIADLHLAFGNPKKSMDVFGPKWADYANKLQAHWKATVGPDDLVLLAGDISWAMGLQDALIDLEWIDQLPGQKVMIRGNHDYWWPSSAKLKAVLPPTFSFIHNTAFEWNGVALGGARLWDTFEYSFSEAIEFVENPHAKKKTVEELAHQKEDDELIFQRELGRLKLSLEKMNPKAQLKIVMTHYPPIGPNLKPSRASALLEDFGINICVFGHLHNVRAGSLPFGEARGVKYLFTAADAIDFTPVKVVTL